MTLNLYVDTCTVTEGWSKCSFKLRWPQTGVLSGWQSTVGHVPVCQDCLTLAVGGAHQRCLGALGPPATSAHTWYVENAFCTVKIRRRSSHHLHIQTYAMCCSFSISEALKTFFFLLLFCKLRERETRGGMQGGHGFCSQLSQMLRTDIFGSAGALTSLPQRQRGRHLRYWGFLYTKLHKWGRVVFWTALVK